MTNNSLMGEQSGMFIQLTTGTNERNKLQTYATICVYFKRITLSESHQEKYEFMLCGSVLIKF